MYEANQYCVFLSRPKCSAAESVALSPVSCVPVCSHIRPARHKCPSERGLSTVGHLYLMADSVVLEHTVLSSSRPARWPDCI